ncbi:ribonuclease D [Paralimibaculum aggregatum]|uniref:Ribonuclease D n=1 Tax=Paralimibaculum aggregatum TaxID=3036245 RepID=A0ABQ6LLL0_9RHOB|nr:ribonuclease D [Limibaculum sp. NKW23]GMG81306.1 ribonuclease D [Limibaculum sp. NKW23]
MQPVTDTDTLAALCRAYADAPFVTVDTEFMRERTYYAQLCLVQMARPEGSGGGDGLADAVLIDPLAEGIDLAPLLELMARPVLKVFHAARQDVEIFFNLADEIPAPLFDTQIAAMVCGYGEQVGYETLVRRIAKAELDKSSRFTDWSHRPLSAKQLTYALADVTHLRPVYEALAKRLDESGRAGWVAEEMAVLTSPETYRTDPDEVWRRVKARSTSPRFLAVVRSLARWRELTAQARDVPRNRILKDDALVEVASARPTSPEELHKLRLLQREGRKAETSAEILAAVAEGLACPEDRLPRVPPPPRRKEGSAAVADLLRVLLKARADQLGIASKLLASSSDLDALAGEEAPDLPVLRGWRFESFGRDAMRVRDGEVALAVGRQGIELIEHRPAAG